MHDLTHPPAMGHRAFHLFAAPRMALQELHDTVALHAAAIWLDTALVHVKQYLTHLAAVRGIAFVTSSTEL